MTFTRNTPEDVMVLPIQENPEDELEKELGNIHESDFEKVVKWRSEEKKAEDFKFNFFKNYNDLSKEGGMPTNELFEEFKEYWDTQNKKDKSASIFHFLDQRGMLQ